MRTAQCYPLRTLNPESRLGPYEIVSLLGSGGMGEVYRARDTRLERIVAIKVVAPEYAQRFEREAKSISSLNHPHICSLFDVGPNYLVMELLEGETLAERLARGPLPLQELLRYAIQIADALDRAHRSGIVHRDLKPGNIMLTKSGAKLLDFGLARDNVTNAALGGAAAETAAATRQRPLTEEGTIVGTFQYMAPEQLEGRPADARSDIFAFGAVLYEMTTGKRAFSGNSRASLIASIIAGTPAPISTIQPLTPPALDRVVQVCLAKDPDARWQSAHDVAEELRWISEAGSQAGVAAVVSTKRRVRERAWVASTVALLAVAAVLAAMWWRGRPSAERSLHASILPPAGSTFAFVGGPTDAADASSLTISPDGRFVTFAARGADGGVSLWLRRLDSDQARPLPGTEFGYSPFWSPDSKSIGFFASGKLKRISVDGGPAVSIADAPAARGGSWNSAGVILFAPSWRDAIYRVSADGGRVTPVTKVDEANNETTNRWPWFLPDGKHFIYLAASHKAAKDSDQNAIYLGSVDSPQRTLLLRARTNAIYVDGYILFGRENYLMAQAFDAGKLKLSGDPVRVIQGVYEEPGFFRSTFAAAGNGTLVYATGTSGASATLTWLDRSGKVIGTVGKPDDFHDLHFAPDGKHVAISIGDTSDIWLLDLERGVQTRFTTNPMNDFNPVWTPDGKQIIYASDQSSFGDIFIKEVNGLLPERLLVKCNKIIAVDDVSPDGRQIAFDVANPKTPDAFDVFVASVSDGKAVPFIATEFLDAGGTFSRDMKWLTYASNESGKIELYAVRYPDKSEKRQLTNGGIRYYFRPRRGNEIFLLAADGTLQSIRYEGGEFSEPKVLFKFTQRVDFGAIDSFDGQRFLAAASAAQETSQVSIVTNWTEMLKGR